MSRIDIEILKPGEALESFTQTWKRLGTGKKARPRLAFGNLKELFSAITQKRLEIVRYVAEHEGLNCRQLAQQLGRNYKNVYVDVKELVEFGLLDRDDRGHLSSPYDEIVIHAPIRDAA